MPVAEYQESPLHGFPKSTRIGNDATLNLEFHLVGVLEHLELAVPCKALCNIDQLSIKPRKLHSTIAHSKTQLPIDASKKVRSMDNRGGYGADVHFN